MQDYIGNVRDGEGELRYRDADATPVSISNISFHGVLGEGANGVVFDCRDDFLDRPVAVKVYPRRSGRRSESQYRSQVALEIRKLAGLNHFSIASVYSGGFLDSGLPYVVMQRSPGRSIRQIEDRFLQEDASYRSMILMKVFGALKHAEACDVLHGDLHFGNVIISDSYPEIVRLERGSIEIGEPVQVIDFGTSILAGKNRSEKRHSRLLKKFSYEVLPELKNYCEPLPRLAERHGKEMLPRLDAARGFYSTLTDGAEIDRLGINLPDFMTDPDTDALRVALAITELQDFSLRVVFDRLAEYCDPAKLLMVKRYLIFWLSKGTVAPSSENFYPSLFKLFEERGFAIDEGAAERIAAGDAP